MIVNVAIPVMSRRIYKILGRKIVNNGQPQAQDKYKKDVVERLVKVIWKFPKAPLRR
jgi:hypothetical protein